MFPFSLLIRFFSKVWVNHFPISFFLGGGGRAVSPFPSEYGSAYRQVKERSDSLPASLLYRLETQIEWLKKHKRRKRIGKMHCVLIKSWRICKVYWMHKIRLKFVDTWYTLVQGLKKWIFLLCYQLVIFY